MPRKRTDAAPLSICFRHTTLDFTEHSKVQPYYGTNPVGASCSWIHESVITYFILFHAVCLDRRPPSGCEVVGSARRVVNIWEDDDNLFCHLFPPCIPFTTPHCSRLFSEFHCKRPKRNVNQSHTYPTSPDCLPCTSR